MRLEPHIFTLFPYTTLFRSVRRKIVVFMSAETGSGRGSFVNARHGTAAPADMVTHCLTERSRQAFGHVLPAYDARPVNAVGHLGHRSEERRAGNEWSSRRGGE